MHERSTRDWAQAVLTFWFDEVGEEAWFDGGRELDVQVDARFRDLHERFVGGLVTPRLDSPREMVAAIVLLDQFSRHLYRGSPRAYACDTRARELSRHVVETGLDRALTPQERLFTYMPLQHSEDRRDQQESVRLFESLGNAQWTASAVAHRDVVERFGRFPHRNQVLGRASTPEELEAIAGGAAW